MIGPITRVAITRVAITRVAITRVAKIRPLTIRARAAAAGILSLVCLSGCANGTVAQLPPAPATVASVSTTTVAETPGGYLASVAGTTHTPAPALGPGTSTLGGTVTGPSGRVPAAVVEVDRVTQPSGRLASDQLATDANGAWTLAGVLGGVYRVRAWRAPDLALTQPVVIFVSEGETRQVQLQMQQYTGLNVSSSMAPDPAIVDQPANLVVQVTNTSVDNTGVVRAVPVNGAMLTLSGSSDWEVTTANPATTAANGLASWRLTCLASGSQPLSVTVNGGTGQSLDHLGPCVTPTPTTTTTTTTSAIPTSSTTSTSSVSPPTTTLGAAAGPGPLRSKRPAPGRPSGP